ncbi:MAG: alpha/beta hydrolase [Rikenellaceae bacterium]|nr:alpha/beta hydrolase [Rikenellaceae bacterium]
MGANAQEAPDYLSDPHLNVKTKEYLKVLNASTTPVESLGVQGARNVLINAQKSVNVDLSGIEEMERTITMDGQTINIHVVRSEGVQGHLPVFIFIHGGGWVLGDYPTHKRMVRDLVVASGYACVFPDYTPSPEAHFPVAINQIYATTKWVAQHGNEINVDGKNLAVVGNSVGGNMTLATALMAKEHGGPEIKCLVAIWPVTDASHDFPSWKMYGKQRFLTDSLMSWMFDNYSTKEEDKNNILYSPLRASLDQLKGLPPTLIEVAKNDILRDEGEAIGRKMDQAGVDVTTIRFNGVTHDWGLLNGFADLSETRALFLFSAAWLQQYMGN